MLACLRLLVFLHIHGACLAIDTFDVIHVLGGETLHLQEHEFARHCHRSDVMSRRSLHSNNVSLFQRQVIAVVVVPLTGVLELHFHQVRRLSVVGDVCQIVKDIQLATLLGTAKVRETAVGEYGEGGSSILCILMIFHIIYIY